MGQRRVSSYYIPPNFDPSDTGRKSKPKNGQHDTRFMLPMAIKCNNCGFIMGPGTKANSRKEIAYGQDYLGITVYRLYIHCKECYGEIVLKTDPENSDYIVESGGTRHFEPWRDFRIEQAKELKEKLSGSRIKEVEKTRSDTMRDINQTAELDMITKKGLHQRRPKLSDLDKIYKNSDTIVHLSESDKKIVENFVEKPQIKEDKVQMKHIPIGTTNIWSSIGDGLDEP